MKSHQRYLIQDMSLKLVVKLAGTVDYIITAVLSTVRIPPQAANLII